jgi:hypothetical protein
MGPIAKQPCCAAYRLRPWGVTSYASVHALGDGASWIGKSVQRVRTGCVQTLDFFHACEHLRKAAAGVFGEGTATGSPSPTDPQRFWLHPITDSPGRTLDILVMVPYPDPMNGKLEFDIRMSIFRQAALLTLREGGDQARIRLLFHSGGSSKCFAHVAK